MCCATCRVHYNCSPWAPGAQNLGPWPQNLGPHQSLRVCASLTEMKLPGQEEFEVSSACENVPTGELDSGPGGPLDTDSREQGVPKDPLPFIQLNELLGWPQALEWRETGR